MEWTPSQSRPPTARRPAAARLKKHHSCNVCTTRGSNLCPCGDAVDGRPWSRDVPFPDSPHWKSEHQDRHRKRPRRQHHKQHAYTTFAQTTIVIYRTPVLRFQAVVPFVLGDSDVEVEFPVRAREVAVPEEEK